MCKRSRTGRYGRKEDKQIRGKKKDGFKKKGTEGEITRNTNKEIQITTVRSGKRAA